MHDGVVEINHQWPFLKKNIFKNRQINQTFEAGVYCKLLCNAEVTRVYIGY